ncbi:protein kinase domain containing protein [Cryptosporidium felis]|nr:protein kinase domain containing protein [Cryptosporidium felis]
MASGNYLSSYVKVMRIGQGAFGEVWLAEDLRRRRHVAMKKLISKESRDGFSKTAIREILLLSNLKHNNIVELFGVVFSKPHYSVGNTNIKSNSTNAISSHLQVRSLNKGSIWMVFEYLPYDLSGYIEGLKLEGKAVRIIDIKVIIRQLLSGLEYCHLNNIIHRDIKCANLLISRDGVVKLADFGLARIYNIRNRAMTNRVITLWYRPPELLLGAQCYDTPVDMWSVGCILGELILQQPLFCSETEAGVLKSIGDTLGSPPSNVLFEFKKLPLWNDQDSNPLLQILGSGTGPKYKQFISRVEEKAGKLGLDLLLQLLQYSPEKRLNPREALDHPWLSSNEKSEVIPERLDMSVFTQKKQFHSLNARKLRDKVQGRLKMPSSSEVGGAVNAVIGKAYRVEQIKKSIEESLDKSTKNIEIATGKKYESIPSKNPEILQKNEDKQFKRSRSRESLDGLNGSNKWNSRNSIEHRYLNMCDRRQPLIGNFDERDRDREREYNFERRRHEYSLPREEYYLQSRERELFYHEYWHPSLRYEREPMNEFYHNPLQRSPLSPGSYAYISNCAANSIYYRRNSPQRYAQDYPIRYNTRMYNSSAHYESKGKNEYRDYKR